jgi:hypothetical protein
VGGHGPARAARRSIGRCEPADLRGALSSGGAALGSTRDDVVLINISSVSCRMYGYPGLGLVGPGGRILPSQVTRGGGMLERDQGPSLVVLGPSQAASFSIGSTDNAQDGESQAVNCPTAEYLLVTPPDDYTSVRILARISPCGHGRMSVTAIVAGTRGGGSPT